MNLGKLIDRLAELPADDQIRFDSGEPPGHLCSWRGRYECLTLDSATEEWDEPLNTVGELLADARAAVGATFQGYKGGDFKMDLHTPVWADESGRCRGRMIVRIDTGPLGAFIVTFDGEDYL